MKQINTPYYYYVKHDLCKCNDDVYIHMHIDTSSHISTDTQVVGDAFNLPFEVRVLGIAVTFEKYRPVQMYHMYMN